MAKEKLSTAEILARARAESAKQAGESAESGSDAAAPEQPSAPAPQPAAGKPKSTADILAAARAQAAGDKPAAKPAAPAGKPKSTADILAAARAQSGQAAPAKAGKPAAKAPATAKAAAAAGSGETPSVADMLKAVRGESKGAATATAESAPALPPMPVKPAKKPPVAAKKKAETEQRRNALLALIGSPFVLAWLFFSGTLATAGLALARFMMPNVLVEPPTKFKIGAPSEYPPGTVSTKWKAARGVWIVNTDQYNGSPMIYALSSVCTHLGCTPNWLEGEQKFKCPCHGSGFYVNGVNFEGPAPRPLERVGIRLSEDGMLEVDKSVKFQEELGQWEDPASYYPLV